MKKILINIIFFLSFIPLNGMPIAGKKTRILIQLLQSTIEKDNANQIERLIIQYPELFNKDKILAKASLDGKINIVTKLLNWPNEPHPNINYASENGFTPLLLATEGGYPKIVELLIKKGANLRHINRLGQTALFVAVLDDKHEIMQMLLEKDKELANISAKEDATPLIVAKTPQAAKILIAFGADPNYVNQYGINALSKAILSHNKQMETLFSAHKNTAEALKKAIRKSSLIEISSSGSEEIISKMIKSFPDHLNLQNQNGMTALMNAAKHGNKPVIKLLLQAGADPTIKNNTGQNALMLARMNSHDEIADILKVKIKKIKRKKRKAKQKKSNPTPRAVTPSRPTAVLQPEPVPKPTPQLTQGQRAEQEKTANTRNLWKLVGQGFAKQVNDFLNKNKEFNTNQTNEQGDTFLTYAIKLATQEPGATRKYTTITVLLTDSAIQKTINTPNAQGHTPRALANQADRKDLVDLLVEYRAEASSINYPTAASAPAGYQYKPAHKPTPASSMTETIKGEDVLFAELQRGDKAKVAKIEEILKVDARGLSRQRTGGTTPLMRAIESKVTQKVIQFILNNISTANIELEEQTKQRDTALTKAIRIGKQPWIELLLQHGTLIRDKDIQTAQQLREAANREGNETEEKKLHGVVSLLEQEKKHQEINKALLTAVQDKTIDFGSVQRALKDGADINTRDTQHNTPLMRAIQAKNNVTAKGLIERNARLNIRNSTGETALILAATTNNYDLVNYLLQHDANEKIEDNMGTTAYGHAMQNNYTDISNRILTHKALKNLRRTNKIIHVLNRHTILGKNKTTAIIGDADQDVQNNPYKGTHRDGSTTSFFPRSWNRDKIQEAIVSILEKPKKLDEQPAKLTEDNQVLRNALILRGTYQGVPIKVVISQTDDKHAPWKIFTAYPELR